MLMVDEDDEDRFLFGRKGDHLMTPFQCDICHFRNIQAREPSESGRDQRLLIFIRRANLDALWSREPGTVYGNLGEARRLIVVSERLGIKSLPPLLQGAPLKDLFGMTIAVQMLERSLDPGRNRDTVQFNTARKIRSVHSSYVQANFGYSDESVMAKDDKKLFTTTTATYSRWFERFVKGCHTRMGDQPRPDKAISIEELLLVFEFLEREYRICERDNNQHRRQLHLACVGVFIAAGFLGGLRGEEVTMMDLTGVRKHLDEGLAWVTPHVTIPLLGRFKGEDGTRWFLLPVVPQTRSGINIAVWMRRMVEMYEKIDVHSGWVFRRRDGRGKAKIADFDPMFHDALRYAQEKRPDVIGDDVDVSEAYSLRRSLRRGSTTHARNCGVTAEHIDYNNRWRKHARAGSKAPSINMAQHYTDMRGSLTYMLRYSRNM